ncbi:hypothetical protein SAMN02745866_03205 [Alteromonadaceae bacterium Bs31]|nr:hypothetical protein SAMN02745866_03205 [Alteromonadaceae bacterium Bs31]
MKNKFGTFGIMVGGLALMLALIHFWAGPFSAQPSLETTVAEKAASIRQATIDALKGKAVEPKLEKSKFSADKITHIVTAILGGLAFILAALSFSKHESIRAAGSAAALGAGAIAFQFIAMYAMALLAVILIAAVLASLGGGV